VLFHLRTHGFQDASPLGNLVALRSIKKLDFNRVIPGHGPVTDKSSIDRMIEDDYLLYDEVKKQHNNGLSDFEMKDKVDVKLFVSMSGFVERF